MIIGKCKLCHREGVELQDSHLLPKAAYRLIEKSQAGKSPIVVKAVTLQKNEQVHDHVFCFTCEQRFSDFGERWTLDYCNRFAEGFQLHRLVSATKPQVHKKSLKLFDVTQIASIDVEQLTFFAASVVWRASIHDWKSGRDPLRKVSLGPHYNEEFRKYLLGGPFPEDATLQLAILINPRLWSWIFAPYGSVEEYTHVSFTLLGLFFVFRLGSRVPTQLRNPAFFPGTKSYITMSPTADETIEAGAMKRMKTSRIAGSMRRDRK